MHGYDKENYFPKLNFNFSNFGILLDNHSLFFKCKLFKSYMRNPVKGLHLIYGCLATFTSIVGRQWDYGDSHLAVGTLQQLQKAKSRYV